MALREVNFDIDKPRYDQNTYWGRAKHFLETTNPLNLFASEEELDRAKTIVQKLRSVSVYQLRLFFLN